MLAVIPAAGRGTRMASITNGRPKELLPLGGRTVLDRVVEEALAAGCQEVCIVSSIEKPGIHERFGEVDFIKIVIQEEPRGLADAVFQAPSGQDSLILLGDVVYWGGSPCDRMVGLLERGIDGCIAVETVQDAQVHLYGILDVHPGTGQILGMVEKPRPEDTKSRWAVAARYAFSASLMAYLRDLAAKSQGTGELEFSGLIRSAIADGFDLKAVALQQGQKRVDCGEVESYLAARNLKWED